MTNQLRYVGPTTIHFINNKTYPYQNVRHLLLGEVKLVTDERGKPALITERNSLFEPA